MIALVSLETFRSLRFRGSLQPESKIDLWPYDRIFLTQPREKERDRQAERIHIYICTNALYKHG